MSEFNRAQQTGLTLRQLADGWLSRAKADPEAALLLRDLWEVTDITQGALVEHAKPDDVTKVLMDATRRLTQRPFDGEEVLF